MLSAGAWTGEGGGGSSTRPEKERVRRPTRGPRWPAKKLEDGARAGQPEKKDAAGEEGRRRDDGSGTSGGGAPRRLGDEGGMAGGGAPLDGARGAAGEEGRSGGARTARGRARGRLGDERTLGDEGGIGGTPLDDGARGSAPEKKDVAAAALLGSGTRADDGGEQRWARATLIWRRKTTCWLKYPREPLVPVGDTHRD